MGHGKHVQELGRALLGGLAGELLHGTQVGAGVQRIADDSAPQVVRRKRCHAGLDGSAAGDVQHGLPRHPPRSQLPSPVDRNKERPCLAAAEREPGLEGRPAGIAQMRQALLVALAAYL